MFPIFCYYEQCCSGKSCVYVISHVCKYIYRIKLQNRINKLKDNNDYNFDSYCQIDHQWSYNTPTSNAWEDLFPHSLTPMESINNFWIFANVIDGKWHLSRVLICISLTLSAVIIFSYEKETNIFPFLWIVCFYPLPIFFYWTVDVGSQHNQEMLGSINYFGF